MRDLLRRLILRPGILAGVVVTNDAIPVVSEVRPPLENDAAVLAVSNLARVANEEARRLGASECKRIVIDAGIRYVQLTELGDCYLGVISEGPVNLEKVMLDIS